MFHVDVVGGGGGAPAGDCAGPHREVVLVTGAAQGIGAAITEAFLRQGMHVAAADVNKPVLDQAVTAFQARWGPERVRGYPVDVTDVGAVDAVAEEVERSCGPISVLVNCAGVLRTGLAVELPDADWDALFAVNVMGVFAVSRAVARRMVPRRHGSIITVSSNAGRVPRAGMAGYGASKAAATMFTKSLGLELAEHNIRCNVVAPGSTDTPMLRGMWPGADSGQDALARIVSGDPEAYKIGIPLRKVAGPADIANAVLFLASPNAGHITMQELYVDGGAVLGG